MAANTPVQPGVGGARPNSGRKKGSTALIRIQSLREAFDAELGIPFEVMLARMCVKLHNDFQNNENVDSAIRFASNMAKHMIQPVPTVNIDVDVNSIEEMSDADLQGKIDNLLTRAALTHSPSSPQVTQPTEVKNLD